MADDTLIITRSFKAPRALVFKAWTEADGLAQWWGPKTMRIEILKLDVRPGGIFHYRMVLPDGRPLYGRFTYGDVEPPERLTFVNGFSDEQGGLARNPFAEGWPLQVSNVLTLTEQDGVTTLELRGEPLDATDAERALFKAGHSSMQQGFAGTFEQLGAYLAKAG
jgi:uncharacterized protein YndB with AHSA1/START domain